MHLLFIADNNTEHDCKSKGVAQNCSIQFLNILPVTHNGAAAIFYLLPEENLSNDLHQLSQLNCLVIVNAVCTTLNYLPPNMVRINGWPGFIKRPVIELSASANNQAEIALIFKALGWKYQLVADLPGFISARILAMIINEAYFATAEMVADRADIDTAMKLGTNYPKGPFDWANIIGVKQIARLLNILSLTDVRYQPAPLLLTDSKQ